MTRVKIIRLTTACYKLTRSNGGAPAHGSNDVFLCVGKGVCLVVGLEKGQFLRVGDSRSVTHEVRAVFACAVGSAHVLAGFLHVNHAGLKGAIILGF